MQYEKKTQNNGKIPQHKFGAGLKVWNICFLNDIQFTLSRDAQKQNIRCFYEYRNEDFEVTFPNAAVSERKILGLLFYYEKITLNIFRHIYSGN